MALGDKEYNVEFDDSLLGLKGWTNPRYNGCNLKSLYYNEYNASGDNIKQIGTYQNGDLESTIRLRLPETRYATGVTDDSYGWWMNKYRYIDAAAGIFGDPTIGVQGSAGHAFSDGPNTGGMGPKDGVANVTYSGIVKLGPEETFDTVPTIAYEGDTSYSVLPTIQNTTNTVFVGTKVMGFKEDIKYPGPGPDFSYLIINKAITFDTDDDSFFIIENETDDDPTFEKLVQTNLPWASKFRVKLLDDAQPHNLKKQYGVHYNRGLFSWCARYIAPYETLNGDYQDDNGQWVRSYQSLYSAKHDMCNLTTKAFLMESASNRYQIGYSGSAPQAFGSNSGRHGDYYSFSITGSLNLISGSEAFQLGGAAPVEHTFNPLIRFDRTIFEWVNRAESSEQGLGDDIADIVTDFTDKHRGGQLSGSITVNKDNQNTAWWFQEGGRENIKYMNPVISQSANIKPQSFRRFIERLRDNPNDKLYILTINDALNCDHTFRVSVEENMLGTAASTGPINQRGTSFDLSKRRTYTKVSKPMVTFGSFPFDGAKVGVPGCSPNCFQWMNNYASNNYPPNITIPEGYAPQFLRYSQSPTVINGTVAAAGHSDPSWWGTTMNWVGNVFTSTIEKIGNAGAGLDSIHELFTGSLKAQTLLIESQDDDGYPDKPTCDNWVISSLEERSNVILTNVNKKIDLAGGIGKKGFAIISDNLNPEIRQNLDYYLKKAELISSGPRQKDRNLVRHKPKPGFFKKRLRNKKK
tara:strand:+ start:4590 stop:6833 length:2244 start_codon:yes stop_codon:yes gene_type:complete